MTEGSTVICYDV